MLIIEKETIGGQISSSPKVSNYPGCPDIKGASLVDNVFKQVEDLGVSFEIGTVLKVLDGDTKKVVTDNNTYFSKTIIIATGVSHRKLNLDNEDNLIGKGIHFCVTCDGAFYKDKVVAIVGGGNSAVEESIYLTKFASKVYIIHRRDELRADKIIQDRAAKNEKIEFVLNSVVCEIQGQDLVNNLILKNTKTDEMFNLAVDGVFPYIGITPNVENISGQITQDKAGFIITDETMKTSIDGVFAIGDVRNTPLRQVITAASDGAIAGVYAVKYIESLKEITV